LEQQEELRREREEVSKNATIYDILKLEHKDVKKLFKQIIDSERYQDNVYRIIKKLLSIHMEAEEKFFYEKLVNNSESRPETLEGFEEHEVTKKAMMDVDDSEENDVKFARVKVLNELVKHHVEEEEDAIFKVARSVLSKEQAQEIAKQFLAEKEAKM